MTALPCCNCRTWSKGCGLTEAAQLHRHHGEPGDDSGTVLGFRGLYGIPDRSTDVTADSIEYDGAVPCPRFAAVRGRR